MQGPSCQRGQNRPHQYAVTDVLTAQQIGDPGNALQGLQNCALLRKVSAKGHLGNNLAVQSTQCQKHVCSSCNDDDDHWVGPESLTTDVDIQCTPPADFACNHNVYKLTNHFNS